jgi:hypothetical protein
MTIVYDVRKFFPGLQVRNPKVRKKVAKLFDLMIPDLPKQIRILKEDFNPLIENWSSKLNKGKK